MVKIKASKIDNLEGEGKVKAVELDRKISLPIEVARPPPGKGPKPKPDPEPIDTPPEGELMWGVDRIDAELVWDLTTGSGIDVAVLDTGIDSNHPDLGTINQGPDFINDDDDPEDDNGHGTHCAGIIMAASNDEGVVGVAHGVNIWAVKVLDSGGSGYYWQIIAGIDWAVDNDIEVISMSLSGSSTSTAMEAACDAAEAAGVVIVCAAGNTGKKSTRFNNVQYPALYDSTIAVGATDSSDKRPRFSATGTGLDIVAPGVDIWSTFNDGKYRKYQGTSMACPHVAGTVALMLTQTIPSAYDDGDGAWSPAEVLDCLISTADNLGKAGWDSAFGWGIVDTEEAVTGAES